MRIHAGISNLQPTPQAENAPQPSPVAPRLSGHAFNVRHFRSAVARSFAESCAFLGRRRCAGDRGIFDRRAAYAAFDLGEYTLRLDGRHLTVICPNQTVIDLGEVQRTASIAIKATVNAPILPSPAAKTRSGCVCAMPPNGTARAKSAISAILRSCSRHRRRAHSLAQPTRGTQHVPTIYRYLSQSTDRVLPRA